MAFIPEGYLPLKSAIRRLAEARQISIRLAQAEIRAKLHSGSILAYAMEQSTGRKLGIISDSWATDHALRWLKTGTCLLPNEDGKIRITTERFDMFYRAEKAPICIVEDDLHRLLGEHRQQDPNSQKQSSGQAVLRQLVREVYKEFWPEGFHGRAKERDDVIRKEFERLKKKPPTVRTIQRALKGE
jgi:hypothetical protein